MKARELIGITAVLIVTLLASLVPGCVPVGGVTSYLAVVPAVLRAGSQQAVSVSLLNGQRPATGRVELALFKGGDRILTAQENIKGNGRIQFTVPSIQEGEYRIQVKGDGFWFSCI